jgi:mRNA interferase MazF
VAVKRGEVWRADLSPTRGTEQAGVRPVLIVQTDRANPHSPHTIVVPFTTRIRHRLLPSHVLVPAGEGGLTQDSVALCEQIRVIDQGRLMARLGDLSAQRMQEIADALKAILELP